jgi:GNAT superfamily N-acetyltransferase
MSILVTPATPDDVRAIAEVRTAAAAHLTTTFGGGHWSTRTSEAAVRDALRTPLVLVARIASLVVGTLRLQTRKPRTIDITYFTPVRRPLYVVDVAVHPDVQRQGIGRQLMAAAADAAARWPANGIRLDTYDDPAGGGRLLSRLSLPRGRPRDLSRCPAAVLRAAPAVTEGSAARRRLTSPRYRCDTPTRRSTHDFA